MILCNSLLGANSVPFLPVLQLYLDSFDSTSITKTYQNLAATGTGTSGTTVITASGSVASLVKAGELLRIGGTDIYTVLSVTGAGLTINTVETLSTNYVAQAMALDRVSQWNDKSGKGNHVTQGTALIQPVYNPAQLNSNAVISFDGTNALVLPSALYSIANGANTIFVTSKRDTEAGTTNVVLSLGEGADVNRTALSYNSTSGQVIFINHAGAGSSVTKSGNTNTNYQILMGSFNGGTGLTVNTNNGTAATSTTGAVSSAVDRGSIGARTSSSLFLIGDIAQIVVYNRLLSTTEIIQVNKFLAQKTGITI